MVGIPAQTLYRGENESLSLSALETTTVVSSPSCSSLAGCLVPSASQAPLVELIPSNIVRLSQILLYETVNLHA